MRKLVELGCAWVLLPFACGFLGGISYSRSILGHQPSGAGGWFDLRSLDPIYFGLQDLIVALLFAGGACLLFALLLGGAGALFRTRRWTAPTAAFSAALITGLLSLNAIFPELEERAQARKTSDAKSTAQEKAWATADVGCNDSFTHLGWIAYPIADKAPKGNGCSVRAHVAMDSIGSVVNYYLSRAVSWEENRDQVLCVVQNDGQTFLVTVEKKNPPLVLYNVVPADRRLASEGAATWPLASSTPPVRDLGDLAYPNGVREDRVTTTAFVTQDSVEQAGEYYQRLQASRTDTTSWARAYVTESGNQRVSILIRPNVDSNGDATSETLVDIYVK